MMYPTEARLSSVRPFESRMDGPVQGPFKKELSVGSV